MKVEVGNWKEAKMQETRKGMMRTLLTSDSFTVHITEIQNGHEVTAHSHKYEQVAIILQGECDFHIDGKVYPMKTGSYAIIPPNVEHNIHVYASPVPVINLDVWAPRRQEYIDDYMEFLKEQK